MKKLFVVIAIFITVNTNAQWVQMSNGMGNVATVSSFVLSGNNIFAGTTINGVFLSTNNGANWNQTALNNISVWSLTANGNNLFAGTADSGVYISTNSGTNWAKTSLPNQTVLALSTNNTNIYAGTDNNGVYISTNNGLSWSQTSLNHGTINSFITIGSNFFAGSWSDGVYISTNNGTNWVLTSILNDRPLCFATIGNSLFVGTNGSGVYSTTNYGINWIQTSMNNRYVRSLFASGNNLFAGIDIANAGLGGVYLSTNNGTSWLNKNQGFISVPTVKALTISNNYIFAGTYGYSVWRRSLSEIIGIQNISTEVPAKYSLSQNYPNPFNPTTNIKFSIIKTEQVKLIVYDVKGREVQTLVNELLKPGTYEAAFDANSLNSGVYFYKLITGTFSETKKMLLIK